MTPPVARTVQALDHHLADARQNGQVVGLVPTMGALHDGHASLLRQAREESEVVVASIFVNPTQFGPNEDFNRYPRTLDADLQVCAANGVDLVFAPEADVLYPPGFRTFVEVTGLQDVLEGVSRPGHFRGVATVVLKLFDIVRPGLAFFGQKDAQQARIIKQMVQDLQVPVVIRVGPTVREPDGLALSSRNRYLDPAQRSQAPILHRALTAARARVEAGERDPEAVRRVLIETVTTAPDAVLDYAAVVREDTLQPPPRLSGEVLLALAVRFGTTRLIDNVPLHVED
jgi:pantoate--beta-alanine ligase